MKATLTVLITLISGGAVGAIITQYWTNRQTVVGYSVNTTTLGAAEATKSVLPNLKLQLGSVELPVVFTHTVELAHDSGPELDQATVAVTLSSAAFLGTVIAYGPDPVHQISCKDVDVRTGSVICSLGRISSGKGGYKIMFATDRSPEISVSIDARNARIQNENPGRSNGYVLENGLAIMMGALGILTSFVVLMGFRREFSRRRDGA